ncbi:MAG: carbamoyltransferase HypF [Cyanobacteria bacterium J083]|nr:MAG: carbamoyltransferase HypF [Cyanobacteria bacterium J083]
MKQRLHLTIEGTVQGVGFRPFVYGLARELGLTGWVNNSTAGVEIEVEGAQARLERFLSWLQSDCPPLAQIDEIRTVWLSPIGYQTFKIKASTVGKKTALILPDIATCSECLREINDPTNRRYLYPFTNCTNCGPRFSIIKALPYDRANTCMEKFSMCDRCWREYQNPQERRFHAQPNACPDCGPHLELWNRQGKILASHHTALLTTVEAIRQGKILAIKGLGGFHLVVDAQNKAAVQKLRERKNRPAKPFALMYPNLELIKTHSQVSLLEEKLLLSPSAPIVLLQQRVRRSGCNNPYLGVMLPYTPLHHLLTQHLGFPLIATSGNLAGEPLCYENQTALEKLNQIADLFLVHNRPILQPVDDSIARVIDDKTQILRLGRGYAPLSLKLPSSPKKFSLLAVGGELKNTVAFFQDQQIFLSQYIGDLTSTETFNRFQQTITKFQQLYEIKPSQVAADCHPHYLSTQYAQKLNLTVNLVQHHYAHVLACMADNQIDDKQSVLGIAWDGTGYGLDKTIWGGEFLTLSAKGSQRVAHLQTFGLPGGEKAIKQPKRIAIALLYAALGDKLFNQLTNFQHLACMQAFTSKELSILQTMLSNHINTPLTSSVGRLFDGVAAILGICQQTSYEGQAAMELEFAIGDCQTNAVYNFNLNPPLKENLPFVWDWRPIILEILTDIANNVSLAQISTKFHNTLIEIIITVAQAINKKNILLTGGCFQNKYLTEKAIARLKQRNFQPFYHHRLPCNDGGIAVGQILATI